VRGRLRIESSTLVLAALLLLTAALVLRETRDTLLWSDEWTWALYRRGGGVHTLLDPHNGHLSLVPLLLYKALLATAGMDHSLPYRVLIALGHIAVVALLYVYARRRIGRFAALLPAVVLLMLGPAWQVILWPFQIAWLISLGAGLGALLALDRGDRRGEVWASALLALSLASSGQGIVVAAGLIVEVIGRRRPWWVIGAPLALYAVWWIGFQDSNFFRHNIVLAAQFGADAAGAAIAAVTGLTEAHVDANGTLIDAGAALDWGRPLLAVAVVVLAWRLMTLGRVPIRVLALLATGATFWLLSGLQRVGVSSPDASRYLYVGGLIVLLLAVELLRGVTVSRGLAAAAALATVLVVVSNSGDMRAGARYLRAQALISRADLGALELSRADIPAGYAAARFPGVPFVTLGAKAYLAAARDFGSPAFNSQQIATVPNEQARLAADIELANIQGTTPRAGTAAPGSSPPTVDAAHGGQARTAGGCVRFRAGAVTPRGLNTDVELTVPPAGLVMTAENAPASVALRRFAVSFAPEPTVRLAPGGSATLRPPQDDVEQPWHVRVATQGAARACGLP
jgi:hypothetical protein